jgi:hypothetical protein
VRLCGQPRPSRAAAIRCPASCVPRTLAQLNAVVASAGVRSIKTLVLAALNTNLQTVVDAQANAGDGVASSLQSAARAEKAPQIHALCYEIGQRAKNDPLGSFISAATELLITGVDARGADEGSAAAGLIAGALGGRRTAGSQPEPAHLPGAARPGLAPGGPSRGTRVAALLLEAVRRAGPGRGQAARVCREARCSRPGEEASGQAR